MVDGLAITLLGGMLYTGIVDAVMVGHLTILYNLNLHNFKVNVDFMEGEVDSSSQIRTLVVSAAKLVNVFLTMELSVSFSGYQNNNLHQHIIVNPPFSNITRMFCNLTSMALT